MTKHSSNEAFYLSYSGLSTYRLCPKKYRLQYVERRKMDGNPRNSIFGSAIGKVFEWFYERRAYLQKNTTALVMSWIPAATAQVCAEKDFDPSCDPHFSISLKNDLETYVPSTVEVIRRHRLVTPGSVAEFDLTQEYTRDGVTMKLGGRADFLHRDSSLTLQDGKGSKYRDQYVDSMQLIWYATLHYLKYRVAPDRIGFIYWRFPTDPLQWVDYNERDMREVLDRAFDTEKKVRLEMFDASPSVNCRRCDYISLCDEGRAFVDSVRVSSERIVSTTFDLEQIV
jgi:hypothetical protein